MSPAATVQAENLGIDWAIRGRAATYRVPELRILIARTAGTALRSLSTSVFAIEQMRADIEARRRRSRTSRRLCRSECRSLDQLPSQKVSTRTGQLQFRHAPARWTDGRSLEGVARFAMCGVRLPDRGPGAAVASVDPRHRPARRIRTGAGGAQHRGRPQGRRSTGRGPTDPASKPSCRVT